MPGYYIFCRIWFGFTGDFPFERFRDLPDEGINAELGVLNREWISANTPGDSIYPQADGGPAESLKIVLWADQCARLLTCKIARRAGWAKQDAIGLDGTVVTPLMLCGRAKNEGEAKRMAANIEAWWARQGLIYKRTGVPLVLKASFIREDCYSLADRTLIELDLEDAVNTPLAKATKRVLDKVAEIQRRDAGAVPSGVVKKRTRRVKPRTELTDKQRFVYELRELGLSFGAIAKRTGTDDGRRLFKKPISDEAVSRLFERARAVKARKGASVQTRRSLAID